MWMIILALAVQDAQMVECQLMSNFETTNLRRVPNTLTVHCPEEHEGLQHYADAVLAQIDMPTRRLHRYSEYVISERITFEKAGEGWAALPGQWIIQTVILFPTRAAEYGATHMLCTFSAEPTDTGAFTDPSVACISDVPRAQRIQERALERELEAWRLAPTSLEYCMNEQLYISARIFTRSGPLEDTPMPDPEQLPDLCRQEPE